ncbi:hypothetical protein [Mesorhizobium sp. LjNodule214]|uniref:hypothetical protein n=1 Tax=Mesorhizobium sp. LjNodule214 TaxID=3342252 RepID=UPI003ECD1668
MIFLGQRLPARIANWCRTMVALNIMEIILAWIRGCDRDRPVKQGWDSNQHN